MKTQKKPAGKPGAPRRTKQEDEGSRKGSPSSPSAPGALVTREAGRRTGSSQQRETPRLGSGLDSARKSYFQSTESDQRVIARPGHDHDPHFISRMAPSSKFDLPGEKFFTGTEVLMKIGQDQGLTGVRVNCMASVGDHVWVGEREGCFSVWDFRTGERLMRSTKKKDMFVFAIAGPVDTNYVWLGYSDGVMRIFDAEEMTLVKEVKYHAGAVNALAHSQCGRFVFSSSTDFSIVKWDAQSQSRLGVFRGHKNQIRALLSIGSRLYSGADDHEVRVWEASGRCLAILSEHTGGINALAMSGKYLWSAAEDNTIRIWDVAAKEPYRVRLLDYPHSGQINTLCLIGSLMWSSSWSHIFIWDPITYELKGQYDQAHEGCVGALLPVHQSVVTRVWSAEREGPIVIWNTECTFASALAAASDERLESALMEISETKGALADCDADRRALEEECSSLRAEVDRLTFTIDSQRTQHEQQARDLRRHVAETQDTHHIIRQERDEARRQRDTHARDLADSREAEHGAKRDKDENVRALQLQLDAALADRDAAIRAKEEMRRDRDAHQDRSFKDIDEVRRERDQALRERDEARRERDFAQKDRDDLRAALADAKEQMGKLEQELAEWRRQATAPRHADPRTPVAPGSPLQSGPGGGLQALSMATAPPTGIPSDPESPDDAPAATGPPDLGDWHSDISRALGDGDAGAAARLRERLDSEFPLPHGGSSAQRRSPSAGRSGLSPLSAGQRGSPSAGRTGTSPVHGRSPLQPVLPVPSGLGGSGTFQGAGVDEAAQREAQDAFLQGLASGSEDEVPTVWRDDDKLSRSERDRRKMCRDAFLQGASQAPQTVSAADAAALRQQIDDLEEENKRLRAELAQIMGEFRKAPVDMVELRAAVAAYGSPSGSPRAPGGSPLGGTMGSGRLANTMARKEDFIRRKGLLRLGGEPVVELPALEELDDAEQIHIDELLRKYDYPQPNSLPAWEDLEDADQDFLNDLMAKYRRGRRQVARTPLETSFAAGPSEASPARSGPPGSSQVRPPPRSPFGRSPGSVDRGSAPPRSPVAPRSPRLDQGLEVAESSMARASEGLSEAARSALQHPGLPSGVRDGLQATVLTESQDKTSQHVREALVSPVIPGSTAAALREQVETADAGRAVELSAALRRATANSALPPDARKAIQGALDSKERLGHLPQADGEWADEMTDGARKALQHPGLPTEVREDLGTTLAQADSKGEDVAAAVRTAARDPKLSKEARSVLQIAASSAAPPSRVPEAVRELLHRGGGEALPQACVVRLSSALQKYDMRHTELVRSVKGVPGASESLAPVLAHPHRLPAAIRAFSLAHGTTPETRTRLMEALRAWQGAEEAVDDAAAWCLTRQGSDAPIAAARHRLRGALQQGGAGTREVTEAIRFVLTTHPGGSVPAHVEGVLRDGLAASDGHAAPLQVAVRNVLADGALPEESRGALADALSMADGRSGDLAASLRGISLSNAGGEFRGKIRDALNRCRKGQDLADACRTVADDSRTPSDASRSLRAALANYDSRGEVIARAATAARAECSACPQAIREPLNTASKADQGSGALERGIDSLRQLLQLTELPDAQRAPLHQALAQSDAASADLRRAARDALDAVRPHKQLHDAINAFDSEGPALAADVRSALAADGTLAPSVRAQMHEALREFDSREEALPECVRDLTLHHPRLPADERRSLVDALATAQGRPSQAISTARNVSRDTQVPMGARRVLMEALGEDPSQVVELAHTAAATPGMPKSRQDALTEALATADASDAALIEAVRSVVDSAKGGSGGRQLLSDRDQRSLDRVSGEALATIGALVSGARGASMQADMPEDIRRLLSEKQTGGRPEKVVDAVRSALRRGALPAKTRSELQNLTSKASQSTVSVADTVRETLRSGSIPKDSPAREVLEAALAQWEQGVARVTEQAQAAAADPRVPPSTRLNLSSVAPHSQAKQDQASGELASVVRHVAHLPGVPPSRQRTLSKALAAMDGDRGVEEALRQVERDSSIPAASRERISELRQAAAGNRVALQVAARALAEGGTLPEGAPRTVISDALATAEGHRVELEKVARAASTDPAMPDQARRELHNALGAVKVEDQAMQMRMVLSQPGVPDEVRRTVQAALDEETRTPLEQAWTFQREQLRQEMDKKLRSMSERLAEAQAQAEQGQICVDLVEQLGGVDAAQGLIDSGSADPLRQVAETVQDQKRQLDLLRQQVAGTQGDAVPREYDPEQSGLSAEERARRQKLRDAFCRGKAAPPGAELPVEYRVGSGPAGEQDLRKDLTAAWLRGRQEGLGSVVPGEYADAAGLSYEERQRRRLLRLAFWDGLSTPLAGDIPVDYFSGDKSDAFRAGRAQRTAELTRLGAPGCRHATDGSEQTAEKFDGGLRGSLEDLAPYSGKQGATSAASTAAQGWCRGRWLRMDVLGEGPSQEEIAQATALRSLSASGQLARSPQSPARSPSAQQRASPRSGGSRELPFADSREAEQWRAACNSVIMQQLGYDLPTPEYLQMLQARYMEIQNELLQISADKADVEQEWTERVRRGSVQLEEEKDRARRKEGDLQRELDYCKEQVERERRQEVQRLQALVGQLEQDLQRKDQLYSNLTQRYAQLTEQLHGGEQEREALQKELVQKAFAGNVDELVQYYKDREKKWKEMAELNAELMQENERMVGESHALAQKLRALSFVFDSRPTLIRSLYELYKVLARIVDRAGVVDVFRKEAAKKQLPRLEILQRIHDVEVEVDTGKEGARWIIANLFTAYELQHLGTSPSFFIPDHKRPTWRDIQVPARVRERLIRQTVEEDEWVESSSPPMPESGAAGSRPSPRTSPAPQQRQQESHQRREQRQVRTAPPGAASSRSAPRRVDAQRSAAKRV